MWDEFHRRIYDWVIADLDGNGQKDMIVVAVDGGWHCPGEIWLYLNEEPVYVLKDETDYYEEDFGFSSFCVRPMMADLDNDGNLELLFGAFADGAAGTAGQVICLFRQKGNRWEECQMELPDYSDFWLESGLHVDTIYIGLGSYEAYCPFLEESRAFRGESWPRYLEDIDSSGYVVGGSARGMYGFKCVEYEGRNALLCMEKLCGEGGSNHIVGDATFILVWDEDGICRVADWWVEGID